MKQKEKMQTENQARIQILIRIMVVILGMNILIKLPESVYSAMRSKVLYLWPDYPGLGAFSLGIAQLSLCALGFFLSNPVSRMILWRVNMRPDDGMINSKELASIIYFSFALYFFWNGFNEVTRILISGFQKNEAWNPFSEGYSGPLFSLLEALVCFSLMYVLLFKKKWLPGIKA